ncbi:hypothetical protein TUBRATIS_17970 [Tubulinosema ratisbonensis]|uniref:Uncharacterized protein n=1 Tax=Tubulinosema ratisbonensis TaxID=291195 RepID=A0A437AKW3_9MICR|nr:hypothetical protein TUBRATIS_17970 [Tubulinosema ratisbonensis]
MNEFTSLIEEKVRQSFKILFTKYNVNQILTNTFYLIMLLTNLFVTIIGTHSFPVSLFFIILTMYLLNIANIFVSYLKNKKNNNFIIQIHFKLYELAMNHPKVFWLSVIFLLIFIYFLISFVKKSFIFVISFLFTSAFLENDYIIKIIQGNENVYLIYAILFVTCFLVLALVLNLFIKIGFSLFFALIGSFFSLTAIFALIESVCDYLNINFSQMVDTTECDVSIVILFVFLSLAGFFIQITNK